MADYFQEEESSDKDQKRFHPQLRQSSYSYTYSFVNTTDNFSVPYYALMGFAEGAFFNSNGGEVNYNIS